MIFSDVDRPSTWKKYSSGMCHGCRALCCSLPVEATASDLVRLELISEDEVMESPKKIARRLSAAGYVQSFRAKSGLFTLVQKGDRTCVFLVNSVCSVYERRPAVCRKFPEIGPRPGFCPCTKASPQRI